MPSSLRALQRGARRVEIERALDGAIGKDTLVDLDDTLIQHVGLDDVLGEDFRPRLVADAQRVPEASGDQQQRSVAFALQQRIGGNRGAHFDGGANPSAGDRLARTHTQQPPDTFDGGVPVGLGFLPDSSLWVTSPPSGRRPITSVNVPPRSIQNSQRFAATYRTCARSRPGFYVTLG